MRIPTVHNCAVIPDVPQGTSGIILHLEAKTKILASRPVCSLQALTSLGLVYHLLAALGNYALQFCLFVCVLVSGINRVADGFPSAFLG